MCGQGGRGLFPYFAPSPRLELQTLITLVPSGPVSTLQHQCSQATSWRNFLPDASTSTFVYLHLLHFLVRFCAVSCAALCCNDLLHGFVFSSASGLLRLLQIQYSINSVHHSSIMSTIISNSREYRTATECTVTGSARLGTKRQLRPSFYCS